MGHFIPPFTNKRIRVVRKESVGTSEDNVIPSIPRLSFDEELNRVVVDVAVKNERHVQSFDHYLVAFIPHLGLRAGEIGKTQPERRNSQSA